MKINNFKAKIISFIAYSVLIPILVSFFLVSCGPFKPKKVDLRKTPGDPKLKREKNIREGKGFRAMGILEKKGGGNFQFASSNEMWRASLELLEFTPLANVDYSGGVIITDWFSENSEQDPIKITVRFLSNEIRADGLKIIIHKKICKKNDKDSCKVIQDNTTLGQEIKLAILKKAAIIKSDEISDHQKDYSETGPGTQAPSKY
ncbi:MAG: hypothetical protein CMJ04_00735 [Pelagibacteraceae bacterium]|jgi:hypothetical protein|nr:hypothetical protein [Pelagibacteraceae bacterium]|tara:strand:+ start:176 stop:787 length:612 start_codon:yes stop_codon:yes gene_type:complete